MKLRLKNLIRYSLFIVTLMAFSCSDKQVVPESRPNIVLIAADDLGWSDIGCYGSEIQTPNLDKLAGKGMRFTQFHNTSKCFPSRACLLTGVYAQDCGYDKTFTKPLTNAVTLGEVLREAGYLTYWSGKHHGLENPYTRGFDHYFGLKDGACNHFNPGFQREGEGKPAQKRYGQREWCIDSVLYQPYTPEKDFYTTDYFTNYALQYIDEAKEEKKPFFLYLAYTAPHDPLMAWPTDIEKYKGKYNGGYEETRLRRYEKQKELGLIDNNYVLSEPTYEPWAKLNESEKEEEAKKMEVYAAMIDRLDQNIGRVLLKLKESGLDQNTLVLFVSDNGASAELVNLKDDNDNAEMGSMERWISLGKNWANVCNTPFRYYKNNSFEGGINTPLIAYWPGKIEEGSFTRFPGHFIDMMPTLMEIAQADYPKTYGGQEITPLKGQSFFPALQGKIVARNQPLFWQWADGKAVRYKEWKIVKLKKEENWSLFNVEKDPTEINNLAGQFPEKVREMDRLYQVWYSKYN